uniref:Uncharacterized protein n=1 Tax=Plectus sambesii TaxID=2011161 RepID=A0A914WIN3_9BILA
MDIIMFFTIPLYILVLITIIKNRNDEWLKHSFFTLMISTGIADICRILTLLLFSKLA